MIIILNLILVLLRVAFLTLIERKLLGYIQLRKGPNKVSLIGLLQPFADAIKLFIKERSVIFKSNYLIYLIRPIFIMVLILIIYLIIPIYYNLYSINLGIIYILIIIRIGVYIIIISGWSSNSIYSLIGSLRSIAQTISYEVSLILIIINLLLIIESFIIIDLYYIQKKIIFLLLIFPVILIIIVSLLAELNRTPFDFAEGESELVSGFNIEYISGRFAIIFISEYGIILFRRLIFCIIFLYGNIIRFFFFLKFSLLFLMIIWFRGTYPRFRYDNLIFLTWKFYLPLILIYLIFIFNLKFFMF